VIATILLKLRGRLRDGALFLAYLVLFSVFRFFLFFERGNVTVVALGLKERSMDSDRNLGRESSDAACATRANPSLGKGR
jgi:hypothetical protein